MEFQPLEEANYLEIVYSGKPLDLYTFSVFHLNVQDMLDKVSLGLLSQAGLLEPSWRRERFLPHRPFRSYPRLIQAEIQQLELGSLSENITFAIALAIADPNVIAVLQNLAANVVWAISVSGVRGIQRKLDSPNNYRWWNRDEDPVEVGPNLRDVLIAFAEHEVSQQAELTFRSRSSNRIEKEVTIILGRTSDQK